MAKELSDVNYYFITNETLDIPLYKQAEIAIEKGVSMIQYRAKKSSTRKMYEDTLKLKKVIDDRVIFIVNDRVDIALAVDADGVHLGQDDLPPDEAKKLMGDKIIGVSTHNVDQAKKASKIADYIGIGPVHKTSTKEKTSEELGLEGIKKISDMVDIPTVAIGGITFKDLKPLAKYVDMVCAISSVTRNGNLSKNIEMFENKFKRYKEGFKHGD
ncbi:MAG: thiamine phosphate synthase [Thermoplasmatota archaeon]